MDLSQDVVPAADVLCIFGHQYGQGDILCLFFGQSQRDRAC